jgi:hypothetical protein
MSRPRWHDVLTVTAIVAIVGYGAWALWWGDVRGDSDATRGSNAPSSVSGGPQT